jgi:beta-phosphoglucomutase
MFDPEPTQTRAVLWDLDGTLVDSEPYHWLAWRETMAAEHFELTWDEFASTFGQRNDKVLRRMLGPDLARGEIERIGNAKEEHYRRLVRTSGFDYLPGVRRWLAHLRANGWHQGLTTSAPRANVDAVLAVLDAGMFFDTVVTAEDVRQGKPDPQVFLLAAARLAVPSRRCVVVEDSPAGIEGARRAGMQAIAVGSRTNGVRADFLVRTLDDLAEDAFERLMDK